MTSQPSVEVVHRHETHPGTRTSQRHSWVQERLGLIVQTLLAAALLVLAKYVVHMRGWEFISTLPLLTALMGGVVFTLAILLSGTLTDFKESEKVVTDVTTHVRRLYADVALVARNPQQLAAFRTEVRQLVRTLNDNLHRESGWRFDEVHACVDRLDRLLLQAGAAGAPSSQVRTIQAWAAAIVQSISRLETIIVTTFLKSGYYLAGTVVAVALGALTFTSIHPFEQGLLLHAFAAFLLVGLFLLIRDIDNPFAGSARIDLHPLHRLVEWIEGTDAPAPPPMSTDARTPGSPAAA